MRVVRTVKSLFETVELLSDGFRVLTQSPVLADQFTDELRLLLQQLLLGCARLRLMFERVNLRRKHLRLNRQRPAGQLVRADTQGFQHP